MMPALSSSLKTERPVQREVTTEIAIKPVAVMKQDIVSIALKGAAPVAATPTFSPVAGTYTTIQTVTISTSTPSATIYYTTDGTTPTTNSTVYSAAITVSTTETLSAIATATGDTTSAVGSALYTINLPTAATPSFSPVAGSYSSTQSVTISDTTAERDHLLHHRRDHADNQRARRSTPAQSAFPRTRHCRRLQPPTTT